MTRNRGWRWLVRRVIKELYAPTTRPGKVLRAFVRPIYKALRKHVAKQDNRAVGSKETLHAFYDLDIEPITFDFAVFLAQCDAQRQLLGLQSIFVFFVPGKKDGLREELPDYDAICDAEHRKWRINNILIPLLNLLPTCVGYMVCQSRAQAELYENSSHIFPANYSVAFPEYTPFSNWLKYHKQGASLRVFEATPQALKYVNAWLEERVQRKPVVTVTLRQYGYMTDRNSDLEAWAQVAEKLSSDGYEVVIVPDLEQSDGSLSKLFDKFHCFSHACWNLHLRMALYQLSKQNLFVNGGPASICYFSDANYIMFKIVTPTVPQATKISLAQRNLKFNETPPFAKSGQKWIWDDDRSEIILKSFSDIAKEG